MNRGFTLIELIVALGLSWIVLAGLAYLVVPAAREHALSLRAQSAHEAVAGALVAADRSVRQATWIGSPAGAGESERLEGCENAVPGQAGLPPTLIDPALPARWFAVCAKDGALHYHAGAGCPGSYVCGNTPVFSFGGGPSSSASARFARASARVPVVEIELSAASGGADARASTEVAYAAAAEGRR